MCHPESVAKGVAGGGRKGTRRGAHAYDMQTLRLIYLFYAPFRLVMPLFKSALHRFESVRIIISRAMFNRAQGASRSGTNTNWLIMHSDRRFNPEKSTRR